MYKEFVSPSRLSGWMTCQKLNDALKNGRSWFYFYYYDIYLSYGSHSDLAKMSVVQFLKIDDSRGADVFIVDESINTVGDLRGKKIACALAGRVTPLMQLEGGGLTNRMYRFYLWRSVRCKNRIYNRKCRCNSCLVARRWGMPEIKAFQSLTSTELAPQYHNGRIYSQERGTGKEKRTFC